MDNSMISYYDTSFACWVYVGNYPLPEGSSLDPDVLPEKIELKSRLKATLSFGDSILGNLSATVTKGSRRTKERKIGDVIKKVTEWRRLYNGVEVDGRLEKYSLEDAAKRVGISKKSLDDYLLQLRNGRNFGFNFNEHKDDKVGILRAFNRQHKKQEKNGKGKPGRKPAKH